MRFVAPLSRLFLLSCSFVLFVDALAAGEPCVSGLQPGQKPGPYSSVISAGAQRGQSQCFICETADRPAVVVFARQPDDALGKLMQGIDRAVSDHRALDLRGWVTFLSDDQPALDPQVVRWGQKHAVRNLPLGIFEDSGGPPSYRLAHDADVTVLLFVKRKVVANFAFRAGELNEERTAAVLEAIPTILAEKK